MTDVECRNIYNAAKGAAREMATAAGYNGEMHDGGSGALEAVADAWIAGIERRIPERLKGYAQEVRRQADPEWAEYQRLRQKFR